MERIVGVICLLAACAPKAQAGPSKAEDRAEERRHMVTGQLEARGISDGEVLRVMRAVPRHRFVPASQEARAYDDTPLPIGHDQTISQPYIVALMSALAEVSAGDRVLEVGTGSGYQAAVFAEMGVEVYSIEILEPLATRAKATLAALGYGSKVHLRVGDGYAGWPSEAPFDAIVVTAAPPRIPEPLKQQLAVGGHLVIPVGDWAQRLQVVIRTENGFLERSVTPVRFVPMTGRAQDL